MRHSIRSRRDCYRKLLVSLAKASTRLKEWPSLDYTSLKRSLVPRAVLTGLVLDVPSPNRRKRISSTLRPVHKLLRLLVRQGWPVLLGAAQRGLQRARTPLGWLLGLVPVL